MQPKTDLEQPLAGAKATRSLLAKGRPVAACREAMLRRKGFAGTTANQRETANLETPTNEAETSLQLEGIMHHPSSVAAPGLETPAGGGCAEARSPSNIGKWLGKRGVGKRLPRRCECPRNLSTGHGNGCSAKVDLGLRMLWECAHHGSVPHITASRVLDKPQYAVLAAHASDSGRERIKAVGTGDPSEVMALK